MKRLIIKVKFVSILIAAIFDTNSYAYVNKHRHTELVLNYVEGLRMPNAQQAVLRNGGCNL